MSETGADPDPPWLDPPGEARTAANSLHAGLATGLEHRLIEAARLRIEHSDRPLLLAVAEAAAVADPALAGERLEAVVVALDDRTWCHRIGLRVAGRDSIGVLSVGEWTRCALEAAVEVGESSAELFTDRRVVARGLGYLGLELTGAPPEEASVLLAPAIARSGNTIWTFQRIATAVERALTRGTPVEVMAHPLTRLDPPAVAWFRPPAGVVSIQV